MGRLYNGGTFPDASTGAIAAPNAAELTTPLSFRPMIGTRWLINAIQLTIQAGLFSGGPITPASLIATILAGAAAIGSTQLVQAGPQGSANYWIWRGTITPPQPAEVQSGDTLSLIIDAMPPSTIPNGNNYGLLLARAGSSIIVTGTTDRS